MPGKQAALPSLARMCARNHSRRGPLESAYCACRGWRANERKWSALPVLHVQGSPPCPCRRFAAHHVTGNSVHRVYLARRDGERDGGDLLHHLLHVRPRVVTHSAHVGVEYPHLASKTGFNTCCRPDLPTGQHPYSCTAVSEVGGMSNGGQRSAPGAVLALIRLTSLATLVRTWCDSTRSAPMP